ncbi:bifunctional methylenetetrahydrofolate dehydrogenase/methenyltetrahydrofolate cyclohydrolase FolD [bacterium]|nr:bifunctional methylenetetrahydrofolate dehydrogenase/methenyltetrahydrofolate cyclohydrolase FolD [candidate division CSSED10-310 bacterium]
MNAQVMDGKTVAQSVLERVKILSERFWEHTGRQPGLAVIMAGDDPASAVYVRNKKKACRRVGIAFFEVHLPRDADESRIMEQIHRFNMDDDCDGMIIQLPLPEGMDADYFLEQIDPGKDVDGFHPLNTGKLWLGTAPIAPCTPAGIIKILEAYNIQIEGREAVIAGRSAIVGKPTAALLLARHATVTLAHSRTTRLDEICRRADLLVTAVGRPGFFGADHIKPGAVVIDVGINRIDLDSAGPKWLALDSPIADKLRENGHALIGDVHPRAAIERASYFTPVPGGVGRMTVAMLMHNTITLAGIRLGIDPGDSPV